MKKIYPSHYKTTMAFYYKITLERKNEGRDDEVERLNCYFLYPQHTHWIYEEEQRWDKVTVEYKRAECRHDREYTLAWKNSCRHDAPSDDDANDDDSVIHDSEEEPTPDNEQDQISDANQ